MGCCISKCRPDQNQIHDKLVISQAPSTPPNISQFSNKISPICPPSPTSSSTSSISSFTCITNSNTISSTSSLSTASSSLSSKDRSFSNDFLWSCYKDNPHIVRINSLKEASHSLTMSNKITHSIKPALSAIKQFQPPPQKIVKSSVPQKRVRSSSPVNLNRQKSFRKEPDLRTPVSAYNLPSRTLRSPSPSRRFNGDKCGSALPAPVTEHCLSKRILAGKANNNGASLVMRNENLKPSMSTNSSSRKIQSGLRRRETCTYRVGSRIDETVVKRVLSENDDSAFMEDIDNPLISLDCFIFL